MEDESERFLPDQAPIEAVSDLGFRLGDPYSGLAHKGHLLSIPGRTQSWEPSAAAADLTTSDFAQVLAHANDVDILVLGTGSDIAFVAPEVRDALTQADIALEVSATRAAVRTYNVLFSDQRRVAAALLTIK